MPSEQEIRAEIRAEQSRRGALLDERIQEDARHGGFMSEDAQWDAVLDLYDEVAKEIRAKYA